MSSSESLIKKITILKQDTTGQLLRLVQLIENQVGSNNNNIANTNLLQKEIKSISTLLEEWEKIKIPINKAKFKCPELSFHRWDSQQPVKIMALTI